MRGLKFERMRNSMIQNKVIKSNPIQNLDIEIQKQMMVCLKDMMDLTKAMDAQSLALNQYQLENFQELETQKNAALQKYTLSIEKFLQLPLPKKQVQPKLKDFFLESYQKLKSSMQTNQMMLGAIQDIQNTLLQIYKKYVEETFSSKSYGYKGIMNKSLSAQTFHKNM